MRILALCVLLAGSFFTGNVQADAARCEGCSASGMRAKAISLGIGTHIISSLSTNTMKSFYVWSERDSYRTGPKFFAMETGVPADLEETFVVAREFYQATNGTMRGVVEVNADDLGVAGLNGASAYVVMSDYALKGRLADRLGHGNLPGVFNNLDRAGEKMVQGAFAFIGVSGGSIEITVRMSDGSKVVFRQSTENASTEYQADRSRTPDGQPIPEANSAEYQGTWYGGGNQGFNDNMRDLANYLDKLGASITFNDGGGGRVLSCSWDGEELKCFLK